MLSLCVGNFPLRGLFLSIGSFCGENRSVFRERSAFPRQSPSHLIKTHTVAGSVYAITHSSRSTPSLLPNIPNGEPLEIPARARFPCQSRPRGLFSETPERTHTEFSFSSAHRSAAYPFINYFLIWFTNYFKTRYETVNFVTFSVCRPVFAHFLHRLTGNFSFLFAVFLVYLFYMSTDEAAVSPLFDAGIAPGENAFPGG